MKLKTIGIMSLFAILGLVLGFNVVRAEDGSRISQVKENIEVKFEKNKNVRNIKIEERKEERKEFRASTTEKIKEMRASTTEKIKEMREERKDIRASTTAEFKALKNERGEMIKKMQSNAYEMRKKALLNELNATLNNLVNVRAKIQERITMLEGKGRDMTKAKADLVIADDKISKAKTAIEAFASLPAPTSVTIANGTTTQEVNLEKPRKTGDDAIKAVKSARDALKVVLKSIASTQLNTASSTVPVNQ